MKPVLCKALGVCKSYVSGGVELHAVRPLEMEIRSGELTLLMGPSGSGKTTLISMLAGLLTPSSGSVQLFGDDLTLRSERERSLIRRHQVGFVFQQDNLFPALSALDNVVEILRLKGLSKQDANGRARDTLTKVGLGDRLSHLPAQLSGGQRQRVAIARALAGFPRLVFGDEVTAALDGKTAFSVMGLLREFVSDSTGVLIVTHDSRLERFADRVLSMEDGHLVSDRNLTPLAIGATS